jgi:hypothetical protein
VVDRHRSSLRQPRIMVGFTLYHYSQLLWEELFRSSATEFGAKVYMWVTFSVYIVIFENESQTRAHECLAPWSEELVTSANLKWRLFTKSVVIPTGASRIPASSLRQPKFGPHFPRCPGVISGTKGDTIFEIEWKRIF